MESPEKNPDHITCSCQHCGGHIKFDVEMLRPGEARNVECPHCHLETIIARPKAISSTSKSGKSTKIELFLFELTRYPVVTVALLILLGIITVGYLAMGDLRSKRDSASPVISYSEVAPVQETSPNAFSSKDSKSTPSGTKMAGKNVFPQPVADFLLKHIGFSLKKWLDALNFEQKQSFLNNLATVLQTANTKNLTDKQMEQLVTDFGDNWIDSLKYNLQQKDKIEAQRLAHFNMMVQIGFALLLTLLILCLVLVLLAIERNTRHIFSQPQK
jgi:hypothetical protein